MHCKDIIECRGIVKTYLDITALTTLSFTIKEGESVALVGANGSGKTTLINILLGLIQQDEGTCSIMSTNTLQILPEIRSQLGFVADHASPITWASAKDIALLYRSLYPAWNERRYNDLITLWNLDPFKRLNQMSKGQKRLAEIAIAAATEPRIMILDEPFNGLDAVMRIQVQRLLRLLQKDNAMTIVYATHILTEIPAVADRMIILRRGTMVCDTPVNESVDSPEALFIRLYNEELCGS